MTIYYYTESQICQMKNELNLAKKILLGIGSTTSNWTKEDFNEHVIDGLIKRLDDHSTGFMEIPDPAV